MLEIDKFLNASVLYFLEVYAIMKVAVHVQLPPVIATSTAQPKFA